MTGMGTMQPSRIICTTAGSQDEAASRILAHRPREPRVIMNTAQKKLVGKIAFAIFLLVLIASAWPAKGLFPAALSANGDLAIRLVLGAAIILGAAAGGRVPTYTERHDALNRFYDQHPGAKVFLVACAGTEAIGLYYAGTHHIDLADKAGFFGLLAAVLAPIMLPLIGIRLKDAYDEAGKDG